MNEFSETSTKPKSKILIAVVTCDKYKARVEAQLDTWIPLAREIHDVEVFNGDKLGVPDDYLSLPLKTQAICKWATDREYDHLLKIDDDGYIRTDKLIVPTCDYAGARNVPNDYGYLGTPGRPVSVPGTHPYEYANGGAYWLSRRVFMEMARQEINDWAEDRWVGNTLGRLGIPLVELSGYKPVGPCPISRFLVRDTIVLMQIQNPRDMYTCHTSKFDTVIKTKSQILRPIVQRGPRRRR